MPDTPYYAVIFTSQRSADDPAGYAAMADRMAELAARQPGYLGIETVRGPDGMGITISYGQTLDDIRRWRDNAEHRVAQTLGRDKWYVQYRLRVCRVESDREFES